MTYEETEKAADLLVAAAADDPETLAGIERAYRVKAEANPGRILPFREWLREVWAKGNVRTADGLPGGYTPGKAEKVAKIEYRGDGLVEKILSIDPNADWLSYVEEGRVHYRFDAKRGEDAKIEKFLAAMKAAGCSDAEAIYDFDDEWIPCSGSRPFSA